MHNGLKVGELDQSLYIAGHSRLASFIARKTIDKTRIMHNMTARSLGGARIYRSHLTLCVQVGRTAGTHGQQCKSAKSLTFELS